MRTIAVGMLPTAPALQGAIDHAAAWLSTNPTHVVVVVLATDGIPEECSPQDIPSIAQIAENAYDAAPGIETFVIGVGTETSSLDAIAASGGSGQALIIDTSGNTNQQFFKALNEVRGTAVGCAYLLPTAPKGMPLDPSQLNLEYTPSGGMPVVIPAVQGLISCPATGDAWYYDKPVNPTEMVLCPATCSSLGLAVQTRVNAVLGCQTVVQ